MDSTTAIALIYSSILVLFFGALIVWGLFDWSMKRRSKLQEKKNRAEKKRHDTEVNIGRRIANALKKEQFGGYFYFVDHYHASSGYCIFVRAGTERVLMIRVNLSGPAGKELVLLLGDLREEVVRSSSAADDESVGVVISLALQHMNDLRSS